MEWFHPEFQSVNHVDALKVVGPLYISHSDEFYGRSETI